jgi:MoxR-like ATPase
LLLLAALCGEHLLLLGPPGTAKSEMVRGADASFAQGQRFVLPPCTLLLTLVLARRCAQGRRLSALCAGGAPFFERLLTRFSVPEELFGPLSLRALERDEYERRTEGYLPQASVAFIDEARALLHARCAVHQCHTAAHHMRA